MVIGQTQAYVTVVVVTALIGARRGWAREVITCAIILGAVLFLSLGGLDFIWTWLTHDTVRTASAHGLTSLSGGPQPSVPGGAQGQYAPGSASGGTPTSCCVAPISIQVVSAVLFIGLVWIAYYAGRKYGAAPKNYNHRMAGLIPGAVNGAAMVFYVSHSILPELQLIIDSPGAALTSNLLPVVFGLGLLFLLLVLFMVAQTAKSGK